MNPSDGVDQFSVLDERAKLRARIYSRGWHDAIPVRASDARGGGAPPARTDGYSPQSCGLGCRIRQRRRDEARVRPTAGDHSASLSRVRRAFDLRLTATVAITIEPATQCP